jgi:histidyl-tRNA synthetase
MAQNIQRPKGTQDLYFDDMARWQQVETLLHQHLQGFGYAEIRTPVFETTELFARGVGETTDIVNKEMYTFTKGDRSLTLRPENSASVVRAFVENGLHRRPKPVRLYYLGPMFRYERPQAGRQRQFHQCGIEMLGLDTPASDVEVLWVGWTLFQALGVPNLTLKINNIGSGACRDRFKDGFRQLIDPYLANLCPDCQTRYHTNPLRMLDCKVPEDAAIYRQPDVTAYLEQDFTTPEFQAHFAQVTQTLTQLGVPLQRDVRLVRGLDYYTGVVFELVSGQLGAQNTVCGGGRYNNLIESLGGPPTPATGWALGMERLMQLVPAAPAPQLDVYVVTDQPATAFQAAKALQAHGLKVQVDVSGRGFGKQLGAASQAQARWALILGEAEVASGQVAVKNLATNTQTQQPLDALLAGQLTPVFQDQPTDQAVACP